MTTDEALLMDQLRAELAVATAQVDELRGWVERWKLAAREVGFAPEGSHPDEQKPRAETWHAERLNWIAEVNQLRAQVDALTAEARAWKDAATAPEAELAKGGVVRWAGRGGGLSWSVIRALQPPGGKAK